MLNFNYIGQLEAQQEHENIENEEPPYSVNHKDHGHQFISKCMSLSKDEFISRFRLKKSSFMKIVQEVIAINL